MASFIRKGSSAALALLLAASLLAGCSSLTSYAAKVNGEIIPTSELDQELEAILENKDYLEQVEAAGLEGGVAGAGEDTFTTAFVGRILTRQIFFELINQEVTERKLSISKSDEEAAALEVRSSFGQPEVYRAFPEDYRADLVRRTAEVTALQAALAGVDVDDAAVQMFYDENSEQFNQTCVSHILVETAEQAAAIRAQVAAGGDFKAAAAASSTDPGSGPNGGDLGCVPAGSFVPEFETAMNALAPGELSQPVQTQFGFHIIMVTERKAQPLDEVSTQIRQQLLGQGQVDFDAFIQEAVTGADIDVNPRYGTFSAEGAQAEIIPPNGPTPDEDEAETPVPQDPSLVPQPPVGEPPVEEAPAEPQPPPPSP